jgi:hypothetical protein
MRYLVAALLAALIGIQFFITKPEGKCLSWLDGQCIKMSFATK